MAPLLHINLAWLYEYGCSGFRQIFLGQVEKDKERRVSPQIEVLTYNSSLVMSH